jgi:hypothetical protein
MLRLRRGVAPIALFLLVSVLAAEPAHAWTWTFSSFDDVPAPYADPREPALGVDAVEDGIWSARVGRSVELGRGSRRGPGALEVGLDGSVWLWFSSLPRFNFPLETVDGTFGFWAGARGERVAWRVRLSHWSGHVGDGAETPAESRIIYSRESLAALVFVDAAPHVRVHLGPSLFVRADPPTQPLQFQLGGEWRGGRGGFTPRAAAGGGTAPFVAVDLRAKAENEMRVNQSYRAGVRFAGPNRGGGFRVQLGYDRGHSERGQAYLTPERFVSLGCAFGD